MRNLLTKNIIVFCIFLSSAFSITYWAIAKYDVYKDYKACGDAQEYIKMSKHDYSDVQRRYRYRIIMPYLVSLLDKNLKITSFLSNYYEDVDKKTVQLNFGIINIFSLALTAYVLFYYCRAMGFSQWESLTGGFLFLTSFFVVNYYTAPMVDSLSSLFIIWGFYSVLTNSLPGLFISFSLGVFTKETMFVIPLLILLTERKVVSKKILACVPATIAYIIFVLSLNSGFSRTDTYVFRSLIDFEVLSRNIVNGFKEFTLYSVIEYVQTFMFLWILMAYALFKVKLPDFLRRCAWLLPLIFLTPLLVSCAAVGRVAFYLFPVTIPLSLFALKDILASGLKEGV